MPDSGALRPGDAYPLGASVRDGGVNFAVYSRGAERVELCLIDDDGGGERRFDLPVRTGFVWHGFAPGLRAGQLYGYRVHGPFDPGAGLRFNAAKLLIDPYARALSGTVDWSARPGLLVDGATRDAEDNAAFVPKGVVLGEDGFDWQGVEPPRRPWDETVVYETHVRGFSLRHPGVPEEVRGSFLGLAAEASIAHLKRLGVTAVELLPVTARAHSRRLHELGLKDYWGYGPLAYFAPDAGFSASGERGSEVTEFKTMVRELHRNGIEVILDVVYNHTAESDHEGPTLSFRGIDNATYYRLDAMNPAHYVNFTGTGNTLNLHERPVMRLVLDSLRYWVTEMGVDGFRFDLAASLGRRTHEFDGRASFLDAVYQDPVLSGVKLIAEPWDLGPDGYVPGRFPAPWWEWNDRYRDDVRRYWRGDEVQASQIAQRLTGSPDVFGSAERGPQASINFVTCHDGFTLQDLVSYERKHNLANGENNRDGADENYSQNFGVEGPAASPEIESAREQQKRNLLATLLFSQGVPMLLGGDEIGRTQLGNNNAYNQDNPASWYEWRLDGRREQLLDFTARLIAIRQRYASLRGGDAVHGRGAVRWLREDGREMTDGEWHTPWYRCFAMHVGGGQGASTGAGERDDDPPLLLILNASESALSFRLPPGPWGLLVDTARPEVPEGNGHSGDRPMRVTSDWYAVAARSLVLLRDYKLSG